MILLNQNEVATRAITVLMVEDSPNDTDLTIEAMKDAKMRISLYLAEDGVEAMRFLRCEGDHAEAPRPDLILLDLNLPKKGGREVLAEIKGDKGLASIPVIVLTSSEVEEDILGAYELRANAYVSKPVDFQQFITVVKSIQDFWFTIVKLPGP